MKRIFYIAIFCLTINSLFAQTRVDTGTVFVDGVRPDTYASYPGGYSALSKYINDNVTRNMSFSKEESHQLRKAIAKFTVDQNGRIDSVVIMKSSEIPRLDSLLIIALKNMPQWLPGTKAGKPIKQQFVFPLQICLK